MVRGTTPTLKFIFPVNTNLIEKCYITFVQGRDTVLEKTKEDCEVLETELHLPLTQEETLKFDDNDEIEIQIRVKTTDGKARATQIIKTHASRILKDGEI